MTIKQHGGIFGRNPTFNEATVDTSLSVGGTSQFSDDVSLLRSNLSLSKVYNGSSEINFYNDSAGSPSSFKILVNSNEEVLFDIDPDANIGAERDLIVRGNGATEIARFNVAGDVTLPTGNLVIGTSGQGIDFSATSGTGTSELFDDYEEGEWTPVMADDPSGGNTAAGGTFVGRYTKVGDLVFITFNGQDIDTTGMTSGNNLYVTGLPYTPATITATNYFTGALALHSVSTTGNNLALITDGTTYVRFSENVSGGANDWTTVGDLTSGSADIRFSLTYKAA